MGSALQIFINYAREDQEPARRLYLRLKEEGFNPWMDVEKLTPGERWDSAIRRALRASDMVIICLSSTSVEKRGYLQKEIAQALSRLEEKLDDDIYLLPVRLENCLVPERLSEIQRVDLFEAGGWERLLKAIRLGAARLRKEGMKPVPAAKEPPPAESSGVLLKDFLAPRLLSISSPADGQETGWRYYAEGAVGGYRVRDVWVIVRSVEDSAYWVQQKASVREAGKWGTPIKVGRSESRDHGKSFEIMAVAKPAASLHEGLVLGDWPEAELKSQLIRVVRMEQRDRAKKKTGRKAPAAAHNRASGRGVIFAGDITGSTIVIGNQNKLDGATSQPAEPGQEKDRRRK